MKEIITDLDESLGMMTQEEAEKYLSLLKKALSGALGKNLIDIVFSTRQVMTGEEDRMLMELPTLPVTGDAHAPARNEKMLY